MANRIGSVRSMTKLTRGDCAELLQFLCESNLAVYMRGKRNRAGTKKIGASVASEMARILSALLRSGSSNPP
jgi:hypothetical protein